MFRMDRSDRGTAGLIINSTATNDLSTPWKAYILGVNASGSNNGYFTIGDYGTSTAGAFADRLVIDNLGNVGIGTSTPSNKLEVAGAIKSTTGGFVFPDGTTQTTASGGILKMEVNYLAPPSPSCTAINSGTVALTSLFSFCACNGTAWVATDGTGNDCAWGHSQAYTAPGSYTWTVPTEVTSVSVVVVGGGGSGDGVGSANAGGGGGGLCYANNIPVTPGSSIAIVVGAGGTQSDYAPGTAGGNSSFNGTQLVAYGGGAGSGSTGGTGGGGPALSGTCYTGGNGGAAVSGAYSGGGGGAAGYAGNGGNGGTGSSTITTDQSSGIGGAGGGAAGSSGPAGGWYGSGGGGGVMLVGLGSNGAAGTSMTSSAQNLYAGPGYGGSGGLAGTAYVPYSYAGGNGGLYGGGGGSGAHRCGNGAGGAVRIIWTTGGSFPSNGR